MANTKVTGDLLADGTLFARHLNASHGITTSVIGEGTNLFYTDTRVGTYLGTYLPANGYDTATNIIASIVDSAPVTLDTLNELAAALGDDPNFATTVTNSLAGKLPLTGGTLTGNLGIGVTPSNWAFFKAVQVNGGNSFVGYANQAEIWSNSYYDSASKYYSNGFATRYAAIDGRFEWYQAPSGTAGDVITFNQAMRLNASGNLSIGNTNDTYKLDVSGTGRFNGTSASPLLYLTNTTGGTTADFTISENVGLTINSYEGASARSIDLRVGGTSALLLTSTGAATFTSSTFSVAKFNSTYGQVNIDFQNNGTGFASIGSGVSVTATAAADDLGLGTGGLDKNIVFATGTGYTERMRITSSGNVGIGTTSPSYKLDVSGTGRFNSSVTVGDVIASYSGTNSGFEFGNNGSGGQFGFLKWDNSGNYLYLGHSYGSTFNKNLVINSTGFVGIGTTSPVSKLHVVGDGDTVTLQKSNNVPALAFLGTSTNKSVIEGGDAFGLYTGGSKRMTIGLDGAMGFNYPTLGVRSFMFRALPGRPLIAEFADEGGINSIFIRPNVGSTNLISSNYLSGGVYLPLALSGREAVGDLVLATNGNIGMGTTAPAAKLHVVGGIHNDYITIGNLASTSLSQIQVGERHYSFTLQLDNNWRTLINNIDQSSFIIEIAGGDAGTRSYIRYYVTASSISYGVSNIQPLETASGGWNTGTIDLQISTIAGSYNLQVRATSYYSSGNTGYFTVKIRTF